MKQGTLKSRKRLSKEADFVVSMKDITKLGTIAADRLIKQIEHPRTVILDREFVTGPYRRAARLGK